MTKANSKKSTIAGSEKKPTGVRARVPREDANTGLSSPSEEKAERIEK